MTRRRRRRREEEEEEEEEEKEERTMSQCPSDPPLFVSGSGSI